MSIKCKAAVIRNNKLTAPYKDSKPLSIEEILIIKKISNKDTLILLKEDWTQAYLSTPHGKPVNIKNRSF